MHKTLFSKEKEKQMSSTLKAAKNELSKMQTISTNVFKSSFGVQNQMFKKTQKMSPLDTKELKTIQETTNLESCSPEQMASRDLAKRRINDVVVQLWQNVQD